MTLNNLKKYISINKFGGKNYKVPLYENSDQAILTHYLQNFHNGVKNQYEKNAINILNNYVDNLKTKSNISIVAEEAIQYMLFEVENIPFPTPKDYSFKFIDLFAGVGGFRIAMQKHGGKCVYSSEWDENAKKTYKVNFGETPFGDITKENVKKYIPHKFDILCAGFPCQPFSVAGNRKGFSDTRGTLFFDIEQIINKHRPKAVFLENVKNFASHDNGRTFVVIREILEEKLDYKVFYKILNSMTHSNVPQNRERIFIVAFDPLQVENYCHFEFPKEKKLTNSIHDILEKNKHEDYFYYNDHKYFSKLKNEITSTDTIYQWRRVYVRENKSKVCPTLTANMGTGGHNVPLIKDKYGIRKLTPRECFLFQGFPEKFILPDIAKSKLYMQAGNSVTVPLIELISENIVKVL